MNLTIDKSSGVPIYEQIRRQVEELVRQGLLAPGTRIPSVRDMALRLGVTKNTVAVAYDELAAHRLIETRRGSGTFITQQLNVATGVDLARRHEMSVDIDQFPPMRWEPYFFQQRVLWHARRPAYQGTDPVHAGASGPGTVPL